MKSQYLSNAWKITVKFKILWLFGFIVTAFGPEILVGPPPEMTSLDSMSSVSPTDLEPSLIAKILSQLLAYNPKFLIVLILISLVTSIVYVFLSVVSEGALVHGVANHEDERQVKFLKLFSEGLNYFWRLLGVNSILAMAYFVILFMLVLTISSVAISPVFIIALLPVVLFSIVAAIFLSITNNYSKRFVVIEGRSIGNAISSAVRLIWVNKSETLKLYFSVFGVFIAFAIAAGTISSILLIPFSFLKQDNLKEMMLILLLLLPLALLFRIAGSVLSVFLSSIWTLGFISIREQHKAALGPNEEDSQLTDNNRTE